MAFVTGFALWSRNETARAEIVRNNAQREIQREAIQFLGLRRDPQRALAYDYTYWDEMARFVHTRDRRWAAQNLDTCLRNFGATAVWVYDTKLRPVYVVSSALAAKNRSLPFPSAILRDPSLNHQVGYFTYRTRWGVMEFHCATIHRGADATRVGPSYGYFVVGKLWDAAEVRSIAELTGCQARLVPRDESLLHRALTPGADEIAFEVPLAGSNGQPVAWIQLRRKTPMLGVARRAASRTVILAAAFPTLLMLSLYVLLNHWVSFPLRRISFALHSGSPDAARPLEHGRSEMGEIARLVAKHFEQQAALEAEVTERIKAQQALGVANDLLEVRLQALEDAYDETIAGWSRALDLRDQETEGHTQRVTEMTVKLARAAGIPEAEIVHIARGALLHDIGKMGIPDEILLKPGKLTDEEWVIMKKHPVYADDLLSPIEFLHPALDIPRYHHEKWDGTGYPYGLRGESIPLSARLFAVVDVWDALRSDRPYRNAWPEEKVIEHILSLSGSHFDPQAVEAFMAMLAQRRGESGSELKAA